MFARYASPAWLLFGLLGIYTGNLLVGFCLLFMGIGGSIQLFEAFNWARSARAQNLSLGSLMLGLVLLVVLAIKHYMFE